MGENTSDDANIWVAASDGELEKVKQFLASGVDINAKDEFGYTPLLVSPKVHCLDSE
jgi:ankyrin repeat protein